MKKNLLVQSSLSPAEADVNVSGLHVFDYKWYLTQV